MVWVLKVNQQGETNREIAGTPSASGAQGRINKINEPLHFARFDAAYSMRYPLAFSAIVRGESEGGREKEGENGTRLGQS